MFLKRFCAFWLTAALLFTSVGALGEDSLSDDDEDLGELSAAQEAEVEALDAIDEDSVDITVGEVYHEPELSEFNSKSVALYTCSLMKKSSLYSEPDIESKKVANFQSTTKNAEILSLGAVWAIVRVGDKIGYIKRQRIVDPTPVDSKNTPPYGVQKSIYIATTAETTYVRKSMSDNDESHVVLNAGTMLSIWKIQDGWAIVPYMRKYGYINLNQLTDLIPVSETDTALADDTPIAAYTSYYKMTQDETNKSRIVNIRVGCQRLNRVMQPGESFNFNKQVGPYRKSNGYQPAWVLINGTSVKGYGGGTCQVSSTLYNALLQLPGIQILQRRPHGPAGASYLPHGVDAAVGNDNLNLRFVNNYDFPIRIEGHTSDDGALLMVIYAETN